VFGLLRRSRVQRIAPTSQSSRQRCSVNSWTRTQTFWGWLGYFLLRRSGRRTRWRHGRPSTAPPAPPATMSTVRVPSCACTLPSAPCFPPPRHAALASGVPAWALLAPNLARCGFPAGIGASRRLPVSYVWVRACVPRQLPMGAIDSGVYGLQGVWPPHLLYFQRRAHADVLWLMVLLPPRRPQVKRANFGLPSDRLRRWCGTCARQHEGAIDVVNKRCEDCQKKRPNFGMPEERKARWCHGCSQKHEGAENVVSKRCEECKNKQPSYGMPQDNKQRWCQPCSTKHPGAVNLVGKKKIGKQGGIPQPQPIPQPTPVGGGTLCALCDACMRAYEAKGLRARCCCCSPGGCVARASRCNRRGGARRHALTQAHTAANGTRAGRATAGEAPGDARPPGAVAAHGARGPDAAKHGPADRAASDDGTDGVGRGRRAPTRAAHGVSGTGGPKPLRRDSDPRRSCADAATERSAGAAHTAA
jgi:hypothetical protein